MNNQRISEILKQLLEQTREQVLPTVYSATMLAGLQELQGLTRSIAEQRAFAQQHATAVPDYKVYAVIDSMGWDLDDQEKDDMYRLCRAMLAAAPAAPVAQEPAPIKLSDDVREFLQEWIDSTMGGEDADVDYDFANQLAVLLGPLYAAPLAAEQPDTVPVPRELLERIAIPVMLRWQEDAHADACAELRALLAGGA